MARESDPVASDSDSESDLREPPNASSVESTSCLLNVRRNFWQRAKDRLWGYDFFISYHWASGGAYAVNLAQRLRAKHFDVFLDRSDYASGDDWKAIGEIAIRNTQRLVLIATREAVTQSRSVEHEVRLFTGRNRQIISIVFGDRFEELDRSQNLTLNHFSEAQLYIDDDLNSLASGPSDKVVAELVRTRAVMRRRNQRALITLIPVIAIIGALAAMTVSWLNALESAEVAEHERQVAVEQRRMANNERDTARESQAYANRQAANVFWQVAINSQVDRRFELRSAHLFLRGMKTIATIPASNKTQADRQLSADFALAAYFATRRNVISLPNDGVGSGAMFNSDESLLLTWSGDTARLWETRSFELNQTFKHALPIRGAQFNNHDTQILTWGGDRRPYTGEATLWNSRQTDPIQRLKVDYEVYGARICRDEQCVLLWGGDLGSVGGVQLWDVTHGKNLRTFENDKLVVDAPLSEDQTLLLTWYDVFGVLSREIWLRDLTNGTRIRTFEHDALANGGRFCRASSRVLTWSDDKTVKLWDLDNELPTAVFVHEAPVAGAQLSSDESLLLSWTSNTESNLRSEALLWDVKTNAMIHKSIYDGGIKAAQFNANSSRVLSWGAHPENTGEARIWDVATNAQIQTFKHAAAVIDAKFVSNDTRIQTFASDATTRLWDIGDSLPIHELKMYQSAESPQFTKDATKVLTRGRDGVVRLWDTTKIAFAKRFAHGGMFCGATFNRDESLVASWSSDATVRVWNVDTAESIQILRHDQAVRGAVFSADSQQILSWSDDGTARLWKVSNPEPIRIFKHRGRVISAKFNRDESRVLTTVKNEDQHDETALWEIGEDTPPRVFPNNAVVLGSQFSRDESQLLTCGRNELDTGDVVLWNLASGRPSVVLKHDVHVMGARFSHDESRLLTWGVNLLKESSEVKLWNLKDNGALIQTFVHPSLVMIAEFSPDESRIISWDFSGPEAVLWDVTKPDPIRRFRIDGTISNVMFRSDNARTYLWVFGNEMARYWDLARAEPLQTFWGLDDSSEAHLFNDYSRFLTWGANPDGRSTMDLWSTIKGEKIASFQHASSFKGAQLSLTEARVLTWHENGEICIWDLSDPLESLSPSERILEFETRTATKLDESQNLQVLPFDEWITKTRSAENLAIQRKLRANTAKMIDPIPERPHAQ